MKKVLNIEKEIIAALRLSGRSIESLIEQYQVSEKQIESYVEKYKDSTRFEVTNYYTNQIDWDKIKERTDLTEDFIMINHMELATYKDDVLESYREFIKKQIKIPQIHLDTKNPEFFKYYLESLNEVMWDQIDQRVDKISAYPNHERFKQGELVYTLPINRLYIKSKKLQAKGFHIKNIDDKIVITVTLPEKIYKGDRLLFVLRDGDQYTIDNDNKKVIMIRDNGDISEKHFIGTIRTKHDKGKAGIYDHNERLVVKEGELSLDDVLKRNNLNLKSNRSNTFDKWLKDTGYKK
jgi:hypothetical protein